MILSAKFNRLCYSLYLVLNFTSLFSFRVCHEENVVYDFYK